MASTEVELQLPTGTVGATLTLYPEGSDTAANTPDTLTESTNALGRFTATVTEAISGLHFAKILNSGGTLIASGYVNLIDSAGPFYVSSSVADVYSIWGIKLTNRIANNFGQFWSSDDTGSDFLLTDLEAMRETTLPAISTSIAAILAKLSAPTNIYTNPSDPNRIELIKGPDGNAYDGTSWDKLSWDAGVDITGESFSFKIVYESERYNENPTEHLDVSGTGVGQLAEPSVTNANVDGLPTDGDLWFFLTIEYSAGSHKTIAQGPACII